MSTKLDIRKLSNLITKIKDTQSSIKFDNLDKKALQVGLQISEQALHQPEDIALTPYMANALEILDKIENLKVGDPPTKMERYLETETEKLLNKYCGKEIVHYDDSCDP